MSTAYSALLHATFSSMELKTHWHSTGLGRPAARRMPHVAQASGREFQPHCELSPQLLSAVQPWLPSKCWLLSCSTAPRSTAHSTLLPLGCFHLLVCLSITNSCAERGNGSVPLWTGVKLNCMQSNSSHQKNPCDLGGWMLWVCIGNTALVGFLLILIVLSHHSVWGYFYLFTCNSL